MLVLLLVTTINIVLNFIFVPKYGYIAAVWCSLFTSLVAVTTTYFITKKIIFIPIEIKPIIKILLAGSAMFLIMSAFGNVTSVKILVLKIVSGITMFLVVVAFFNKSNLHNIIKSFKRP